MCIFREAWFSYIYKIYSNIVLIFIYNIPEKVNNFVIKIVDATRCGTIF